MAYFYLRFPEGKERTVTFSYDDGCPQDLRFSDILSKYGLKGTFNICGDGLRGEKTIPKETMEEYFLSRGHEIAIHGYYHRAPGRVRPIESIRDVLDNRIEHERKFGRIIRGMAYPDSAVSFFTDANDYETVRDYLKKLEIAYARGGEYNDTFDLPTDWYNWKATAHHNDPKIFEKIEKFLNLDFTKKTYVGSLQSRLFYILGHSFEFDYDNNWDRIESICEKISGKDNIWYATNIEICDYVKAYNSLIFSADGSIVYNPTLYKIWFDINREHYVIEPGETLHLAY
ncbi:MAG: polysaccharide deacetylase family protein [Clostridia bacterium]|nr:polysaccharide deacetylase family protein [Clostridia bacterium]